MAGKIVKRSELKAANRTAMSSRTDLIPSHANSNNVTKNLDESAITRQPSAMSMNPVKASVTVPLERRVDLMMEKEKLKEERLEIEREIKQI